jgi:hypothetical protein
MRPSPSFATLSVVIALLTTACADSAPTAPSGARLTDQWTLTDATTGTEIELRRPRIDVTAWTDATTTMPAALATPQAARNIGPGSAIRPEFDVR